MENNDISLCPDFKKHVIDHLQFNRSYSHNSLKASLGVRKRRIVCQQCPAPLEHNRSSLKELQWRTLTHKHTFCLEQDTSSDSSMCVELYHGLASAIALLEESMTPLLILPPSPFTKKRIGTVRQSLMRPQDLCE